MPREQNKKEGCPHDSYNHVETAPLRPCGQRNLRIPRLLLSRFGHCRAGSAGQTVQKHPKHYDTDSQKTGFCGQGIVKKQDSAQQGEQNLTRLRGFNDSQLLWIVPDQIRSFEEQQGCYDTRKQCHTHRLNDLTEGRKSVGKQRVNGAQQPEGHTAQGHSKDALGRGEPGRAVGHHLSVPKRIAYARNEDQCQRLQRAGGFHAFQMGQLEHKDSGQDDRGKQEVFDRNSAAEQGRQQHTGHNGNLPGGGNEPGFP